MYRIEFYRHTTGLTEHVVNCDDGFTEFKVNGDKIASTSYFAREPKRLEFNLLSDEWLESNLMTAENEFIRYISHWGIKLYNDNSLIFIGIIDVSYLEYSESGLSISFTCYDKIKLLEIFSDLKMLYALLDGYTPGECFGYLAQGVSIAFNNELPIDYIWNTGWSCLIKEISERTILEISWKAMLEKFGDEWDIENNYLGSAIGLKSINGIAELRILLLGTISVTDIENDINTYEFKILAKTWRFYNHICPYEDEVMEIDFESDEYNRNEYPGNDWGWIQSEIQSKYSQYGDLSWKGVYELALGDKIYSIEFDDSYYELENAPEKLEVKFTGQAIPSNIFPKGFYDGENEQQERLKVLKAALYLHDLTIITAYDTMKLINKNETSGTTNIIDIADIIKYKRKRVNRDQPESSVLDCLIGDTTVLKEVMISYYDEYLSQKWEVKITIDNFEKYDLDLFDVLAFMGKNHRIIEIKKDYVKEEYEITCWEL